jgi:hypothetical protein
MLGAAVLFNPFFLPQTGAHLPYQREVCGAISAARVQTISKLLDVIRIAVYTGK